MAGSDELEASDDVRPDGWARGQRRVVGYLDGPVARMTTRPDCSGTRDSVS